MFISWWWLVIIEAWVLDRVSIIFSKSDTLLDDSVVDVADMWAGSLFGNVVDSDMIGIVAVSYTHLTLPTIYSV